MKKVILAFVFFLLCGVLLAQSEIPPDKNLFKPIPVGNSSHAEPTYSKMQILKFDTSANNPFEHILKAHRIQYPIISYTRYHYTSPVDSVPYEMGEEAHDEHGNIIYTSQHWWNTEEEKWILWEKREFYYDDQERDTSFICYQMDMENQKMVLVYKWSTEYNAFDKKRFDLQYSYNILSDYWVENKYDYIYNAEGELLICNQYHRDIITSEWIHVVNLEQEYDANGHQVSKELYQLDVNNIWMGLEKKQWEYDLNGNRTIEVNYTWNGAADIWDLDRKSDYSYDSNGNLVLEVMQFHEDEINDWVLNRRIVYTYNNREDLISKICYDFDILFDRWIGNYMFQYEYDKEGRETQRIQLNWDDLTNDWKQVSKKEQKYDPSTYIAVYFWDENSLSWIGSWKIENRCNEYGDTYCNTYCEWDSICNNWYIQSGNSSEKTYDSDGQIITSINYTLDSDSTDWVLYTMDEWYYDEDGNLGVEVFKYWDMAINDWVLYSKTFFHYKIGFVTDLPKQYYRSINIYPNPATGYLMMTGMDTPVEVDVYSVQGNHMIGKVIFNGSLNISHLPQGIYIITLSRDEKMLFSGKIIKR
jgi:hypothetical protein